MAKHYYAQININDKFPAHRIHSALLKVCESKAQIQSQFRYIFYTNGS